MAECNLPKVDVEGSIPFSRSSLRDELSEERRLARRSSANSGEHAKADDSSKLTGYGWQASSNTSRDAHKTIN